MFAVHLQEISQLDQISPSLKYFKLNLTPLSFFYNLSLSVYRLNKNSITEEGCAALSAIGLNPSHLIELDLSENELGNSGVKQICSLLNNQNCKLQRLG